MTQQVGIELKPEVAERIGKIPSATTPGERHLALHYTASYWDGVGDIFENGPLLGGSTRALAIGMLHNENRSPTARLQTYDWFSSREPLDVPVESIWQAIAMSGESAEGLQKARKAFDEAGTFLPVFESLHSREDYWPLLNAHVGYLPGHRDDVPPEGEEIIFRQPEREFSLAFIDGCKSWYGTKHWFKEMALCWSPNADIMFQDFGHYTCFWLPMLVGTFRDRFELICYVDYTYVWRLKEAPSEDEIEEKYPDEPEGFNIEDYDSVFQGLYQEAIARNDRREVLLLQMQTAAAYAYLGKKDEARKALDHLLMQSEWLPLRPYLKQARISPTYTPEGKIEL